MKHFTYSFIIPHRNSPVLLNRCIESIPKKDDVQIIVVDDNSDDDKKPQVTRTDVEVIYISRVDSRGAGHARNVGLSIAKGKWILFPDADDYYTQGAFNCLEKYITSDYDVIYMNYVVLLDGKMLNKNTPISNYDGSENKLNYIRYKVNEPWVKMVRRDFVESNNIQFEETINGNDIFFSLQVGYKANKIEVEKHPIYTYVDYRNSVTKRIKSTESYYCRVKHLMQKKMFLKSLGLQNYVMPLPVFFIKRLKNPGVVGTLKLIFYIFCHWKETKESRSLFVDKILNNI